MRRAGIPFTSIARSLLTVIVLAVAIAITTGAALLSGPAGAVTGPVVRTDSTTAPGLETWGDNDAGQLGDASLKQSLVPVPAVTSAAGDNIITSFSADGRHDLALLSNGTVLAWGDDTFAYTLHWNGKTWQLTNVPTVGSDGSRLDAIVVLSATDAWSVGRTQESNGSLLTITEKFNGSAWKISPSPDPGSQGKLTVNTLQAVRSAGGRDLIAVGTQEIPGQLVNRTLAIATAKG